MVYPASFHRLVLIGTQYNETFNTTLSIAATSGDMSPVSDALLNAIAPIVSDWWDDTGVNGPEVAMQAKLTSVKLNRINPEGRYADATTKEFIYGTPVAGNGPNVFVPAQLATVVSLRTAVERGKASKGRMFLPCCTGYNVLDSTGRASSVNAQRLATGVASLIIQLNAAYSAPAGGGTPGRVSVMSNVGSGTKRTVTRVTAGRVPDTMRSRRSSLDEDPQQALIP